MASDSFCTQQNFLYFFFRLNNFNKLWKVKMGRVFAD
jgi:hypothetical protein